MTLEGMIKRDEQIQKDFDDAVAKVTLAVNQMKLDHRDVKAVTFIMNRLLDRIKICLWK